MLQTLPRHALDFPQQVTKALGKRPLPDGWQFGQAALEGSAGQEPVLELLSGRSRKIQDGSRFGNTGWWWLASTLR